jgi:anti-sigma regulatory factor (Ser/Thr protein kinase)
LSETPNPFTFSDLDGVAFAAERGLLNAQSPRFVAAEIGPVFELGLLAKTGLLPWPGDSGWLHLNGTDPLISALAKRKHLWICPSTRGMGLYRAYAAPQQDETSWVEFGVAAQYCASQVGLSRDMGAQLVGAIGEMQSNIYEHSKASATGIVAFRGTPGAFEFVVADRGIGVLESLKGCSDYAELASHGQALQLTLTEGISRYGPQSGRGLGFRPLFRGLSNLNGSLRFRSGDYALTIDGTNPVNIPAKLWQKPILKGFFASVICRC